MTYYPQQPQWQPPQPPQPRPARPSWWKSLWFVALVAAIIGIGIGVGTASSTKKTAAKPGPTVTATATSIVARTYTRTPIIQKVIATRTKTHTVTYTPPPKPAVNDGTYKVGVDIKPGQWRTDGHGNGGCYWERDKNLSGSIYATIANDNIDGPTIIEVNTGEYLKLSGGCDWRRA